MAAFAATVWFMLKHTRNMLSEVTGQRVESLAPGARPRRVRTSLSNLGKQSTLRDQLALALSLSS